MKMLKIKQVLLIDQGVLESVMKNRSKYDIVMETVSGNPRSGLEKKEMRLDLSSYTGFAFTEKDERAGGSVQVGERRMSLLGPDLDRLNFREGFDPDIQEYAYFAERGTPNRIEITKPEAVECE